MVSLRRPTPGDKRDSLFITRHLVDRCPTWVCRFRSGVTVSLTCGEHARFAIANSFRLVNIGTVADLLRSKPCVYS